ncbi:uncharacterized protein MELLADRAFT_95376 [Melampsora larici-populina 98AG31]|uniref:Secreted protein n=1 Tax=Melampsora larici-populina (strain 98AG31 / pathotype 3-4-7) TaxID=747676 RepID=F4RCB1_MELLP|nr:uncharacterized protein MELLADRAFT_95376 [Melampsora larici-populina 98AG31]EGG09850.1 secreted protein [Melampsora larici-populina 98AG31]
MVPVGAPSGAVSAITWSTGIDEMNHRMATGEAAKDILYMINDKLLGDYDRTKKNEGLPENIEYTRRMLRNRAGKQHGTPASTPAPAPAPALGSKTSTIKAKTTLEAPSIPKMTKMKTYSAEELRHIEKKARQMKSGFDYTYMGNGEFVPIAKTNWDAHGIWGQIRVYDHEDHELLYKTGCCYCGGGSRGLNDFTDGETAIGFSMILCAGVVSYAPKYVMKCLR